MADNASLTAGDGTIIAGADEIGGVKYPRVKIIIGDDGSNDGDISALNPLPITGNISATNPSVGVDADPAPTSATLIGFKNGSADLVSVESGANPLPCFITNAPITIDGYVGIIPGVEHIGSVDIDNVVDVTGSAVTVSGTVTIAGNVTNSGTFAVQAAQSGTWNIGNVTGTVSLPTGASTAAKQPALGTAGTASADVITVQGVASMTPLSVSGTLKTAYGTATAFTKTNANLAASVTAGWKSNAIDNTATKALDALVGVELAAVNTAPAGTKTLYLYAYGLIEGTAYTSTGDGTIDGTEGTLTFPSVTTLPVVLRLIGTIPYPVQNRAINGGPFSVAAVFGGILPDKWGVAIINDTGMTLSVTNIYYQEITNTLV